MLLKIFLPLFLLFNTAYAYKKLSVVVSIEPYQYLVEKIGKSKVRVKSLYKNSKLINNHSQFDLRLLAKSNIYMITKLENEDKFTKIFKKYKPDIKIRDISFDVKKLKQQDGKINPYLWLDPLNLIKIANNILYELVQEDKKNEEYYQKNYDVLVQEIDSIFIRIKKLYDKSARENAYVFDHKWDYFAKRFNLSLFLIEEKIIRAGQLSSVSRFTKENDITILLTSPNANYNILYSVANNTNTRMLEHDIYKYSLFANIYNLGFILFTKNLKQ